MHDTPIDNTQRFYARLAGFMYLLNYATSVFGSLTPDRIGSGDFGSTIVFYLFYKSQYIPNCWPHGVCSRRS